MSTFPVVMDVDTGIDDAMALMYAVRNPHMDVRAVSTVAGNVSLKQVVETTWKILDLMGASDIPVAAGAVAPLNSPARDASYVHGADGLGGVELPAPSRGPVAEHAVELMRRTIMESEQKVTLIACAPQTNLALLLRMHPEVTENLERIVFMGGSASVGNATPVAEFNIWHDPEAADIVVKSGVPLVMYGLDVFNHVAIPDDVVAGLKASDHPVARALGGIAGFTYGDDEDEPQAYSLIGDAGAVVAAVHPEMFVSSEHRIEISLADEVTRGQTVVDQRVQVGEDRLHGKKIDEIPVAEVVFSAKDEMEVIREFLDVVLEGEFKELYS